jgi:hypothetical protein
MHYPAREHLACGSWHRIKLISSMLNIGNDVHLALGSRHSRRDCGSRPT